MRRYKDSLIGALRSAGDCQHNAVILCQGICGASRVRCFSEDAERRIVVLGFLDPYYLVVREVQDVRWHYVALMVIAEDIRASSISTSARCTISTSKGAGCRSAPRAPRRAYGSVMECGRSRTAEIEFRNGAIRWEQVTQKNIRGLLIGLGSIMITVVAFVTWLLHE